MSIYSEIPSYVYKHTNLITGEFYYGYRFYNTKLNREPEEDLPIYVCSSKIKNRIIEERVFWESEVLHKYYGENKKIDAFLHEQRLIKSNFGNKLMLNRHYYDETKHKGFLLSSNHTEETKKKISKTLKANKVFSEETKRKISQSKIGRLVTQETREKISKTLKGNIPWNKGKKTGPQSEEIRKKTSECIKKWWAERKLSGKINNKEKE
jgi:hypothetical protein